ncbi:GerMN domain-containing protein [Candidatus Sumerlaeota bacterium]|nr:GerMN domain-containing protein [Candidatus Sumerlaeota bacterium]
MTSERDLLARDKAAFAPRQAPASGSSKALFVVCFLLGVVAFAGGVAFLALWFGRPADAPFGGILGASDAAGGAARLARGAAGGDRVYTAPETLEVRVLFTADGLTLTPQVIRLPKPLLDANARLRFVMTELLRGPSTDLLSSAVPSGVELLGAYIVGDTAIVDLSAPLKEKRLGGPMAEMLCAYAIVNTVLENVDSVVRVRILVQGRSVETLWSDVDLSAPLGANLALLRF